MAGSHLFIPTSEHIFRVPLIGFCRNFRRYNAFAIGILALAEDRAILVYKGYRGHDNGHRESHRITILDGNHRGFAQGGIAVGFDHGVGQRHGSQCAIAHGKLQHRSLQPQKVLHLDIFGSVRALQKDRTLDCGLRSSFGLFELYIVQADPVAVLQLTPCQSAVVMHLGNDHFRTLIQLVLNLCTRCTGVVADVDIVAGHNTVLGPGVVLLRQHFLIVGVRKLDPAFLVLTKQLGIVHVHLGDGDRRSLLQGADLGIESTGAGTDVHIIGIGDQQVIHHIALGQCHNLTGGICPLGIQHRGIGKAAIQHLHLGAAFAGGIPTGKGVHKGVARLVYAGGDP